MALLPPFKYVISQGFGPSKLTVEPPAYGSPDGQEACFTAISGYKYYLHYHPALDLAAPEGTPIVASADGTVTQAGTDAGLSLRVEFAPGMFYSHSHCSKLLVAKGQSVKAGDIIALVGSTGLATGPHSHFWVAANTHEGMRYRNPLRYLPGGDLAHLYGPSETSDVSIQGANPVAVVNRKSAVLGDKTNFRADPSTSHPQLAQLAAGQPVVPQFSVDGQNIDGTTRWYACFENIGGKLTLGYLHSSVIGPLVPIEQADQSVIDQLKAQLAADEAKISAARNALG